MELSIEAIRTRVSVRDYDARPLSPEETKAVESSFAEALPCPFGRSPRFALVSREESGLGPSGKIGTYGVISGAPAFVVGAVAKGELACVDFGYALEGIVLRATELGLGTCWVGGVFNRGAILRMLGAGKDEFAPAITPIGHAADNRSVRDQLLRRSAGSDSRKPPTELFFSAAADGAWAALEGPGAWAPVLEAARIGPSASNKQSWRFILDRRGGGPTRLHLVMQEDRLYNNMLGLVKLQELDMGIAMRHIEVAARKAGLDGSWQRLETTPIAVQGSRRYIASWLAK